MHEGVNKKENLKIGEKKGEIKNVLIIAKMSHAQVWQNVGEVNDLVIIAK